MDCTGIFPEFQRTPDRAAGADRTAYKAAGADRRADRHPEFTGQLTEQQFHRRADRRQQQFTGQQDRDYCAGDKF